MSWRSSRRRSCGGLQYIPSFEETVVVGMNYIEDYVTATEDRFNPERVQDLVKGIPPDASSIGLDVKAYFIPEDFQTRLQAWEGRCLPDGKRLTRGILEKLKGNLVHHIRRHAGGFAKGEVWPTWPGEDSLGLDRRLKEEKSPARRRARSRSHSLSRAMKEHDSEQHERRGDGQTPLRSAESEAEEVSEAGTFICTFEAARDSGQTLDESIGTLKIVYEIEEDGLIQKLKGFLRSAKSDEGHIRNHCLSILKHLTSPGPRDALPAHPPDVHEATSPRRQTSDFVSLGGRSLFQDSQECSLIKPAQPQGRGNPLLDNDGVVNQLFGSANLGDSRAGGGPGESDTDNISARVVHALEGLRKATEGDKKGNPGTRSSIGSEESLDMYLARGCNTLTVEVCPDVTGKELFDALKRACGHAKAKLQQIEWPCLVTNGIAYGLAALQHGGKDHTNLPNWTLSVAQAVTAKPRDFDAYEIPKDDKLETKPRHPTHFATWLKQAKNEITMVGSVMGLEHKQERIAALEQIEKAHEKDSDVWPESYCYSLWDSGRSSRPLGLRSSEKAEGDFVEYSTLTTPGRRTSSSSPWLLVVVSGSHARSTWHTLRATTSRYVFRDKLELWRGSSMANFTTKGKLLRLVRSRVRTRPNNPVVDWLELLMMGNSASPRRRTRRRRRRGMRRRPTQLGNASVLAKQQTQWNMGPGPKRASLFAGMQRVTWDAPEERNVPTTTAPSHRPKASIGQCWLSWLGEVVSEAGPSSNLDKLMVGLHNFELRPSPRTTRRSRRAWDKSKVGYRPMSMKECSIRSSKMSSENLLGAPMNPGWKMSAVVEEAEFGIRESSTPTPWSAWRSLRTWSRRASSRAWRSGHITCSLMSGAGSSIRSWTAPALESKKHCLRPPRRGVENSPKKQKGL